MQKNGFVCLICCREPHHTHPIPTDNKHCVSKYNNNNNNIEWKGNGAQYRLFIQLLLLYKTHKYIYNVHICSQTPLHSASAGSQKKPGCSCVIICIYRVWSTKWNDPHSVKYNISFRRRKQFYLASLLCCCLHFANIHTHKTITTMITMMMVKYNGKIRKMINNEWELAFWADEWGMAALGE